jgi:hypothetical protein
MHSTDHFAVAWKADSLAEIDAEILRLAMLCKVPILDVGVIERVLRNDASVCGASDPGAFFRLRGLLMLHYRERGKLAAELGDNATALLVQTIVDDLRKRIGDRAVGAA